VEGVQLFQQQQEAIAAAKGNSSSNRQRHGRIDKAVFLQEHSRACVVWLLAQGGNSSTH
jgi:hypothetical protein